MKLLAGIAAGAAATVAALWFWLVHKEQQKIDATVYTDEQEQA
jgi:hypothetical protein